jgi:hypothetical protein
MQWVRSGHIDYGMAGSVWVEKCRCYKAVWCRVRWLVHAQEVSSVPAWLCCVYTHGRRCMLCTISAAGLGSWHSRRCCCGCGRRQHHMGSFQCFRVLTSRTCAAAAAVWLAACWASELQGAGCCAQLQRTISVADVGVLCFGCFKL